MTCKYHIHIKNRNKCVFFIYRFFTTKLKDEQYGDISGLQISKRPATGGSGYNGQLLFSLVVMVTSCLAALAMS